MAYTDAQYNDKISKYVVGSPHVPVNLGTATASGTNSLAGNTATVTNGTYLLPKFKQPTKLDGIRVFAGTIPANFTSLTFIFKNGTSTVASKQVGTMTAGDVLDFTLSSDTFASNGAVTGAHLFTSANGQLNLVVDGTSTASGQSLGSYAIELELHNLFVT